MSVGDYALNALLVAVVIRQIRGKRLTVLGLLWPIGLVGIAAAEYLRSIPTAGNDAVLVAAGVAVGAGLGTGAGVLTEIRELPPRGLVARATLPAAALWILGTGGRMGFALFAENGGGPAIARFSAANRITGASAWTACLLLMALAEVLGRTVALAWRGRGVSRAAGGWATAPTTEPGDRRTGTPAHLFRRCRRRPGYGCARPSGSRGSGSDPS